MTTAPSGNIFTQRIQRPLQQMVQVRRRANGVDLLNFINGEPGGWETDDNLRCDSVASVVGASVGAAKFTFVVRQEKGDSPEFQNQINRYGVDDQVRVILYPPDDPGAQTDSNDEEVAGRVIFHGVLMRPRVDLQADANRATETLTFTALPMPALDNMLQEHQVKGRAIIDAANGFVHELETAMLPATFNYRGRPNRHPTDKIASVGNPGVTFYGFTDDQNKLAEPWTLREALKHILGVYLYGYTDYALKRNFDVLPGVITALNAAGYVEDDRFSRGGSDLLGVELPEVSIHNLGVLEALEKVCASVGFRIAVEADDSVVSFGEDQADRLYGLNIWRRNGGPKVTLDLASRGSGYDDAATLLANNNISTLQLMRDGAQVVSKVSARGQTYVEFRSELKPLWYASQWPADIKVNDDLQYDPTPKGLRTDPYFSKYVSGGKYFESDPDFSRVGRAWGLHCTGTEPGYDPGSGAYAMPSDPGFDWATFLNMDAPKSIIDTARTDGNVEDAIFWAYRMRRLLPLGSTDAIKAGKRFIIEISEDAGATWSIVPVGCESLQNECGIKLNITNLAKVNIESITTGDAGLMPEATKSWWGLIASAKLRVRVTACVEADHAIRYDAIESHQGASVYPRAMIIPLPIDELLIQPGTQYNSGTAWQRRYGFGSVIEETRTIKDIEDMATRRRDALETAQFTGVADSGLIDITRYNLGDLVSRIRGREFDLAVGSATDKSYPTISAITYTLGSRQSTQLQLDDQRLTKGAGPWQL